MPISDVTPPRLPAFSLRLPHCRGHLRCALPLGSGARPVRDSAQRSNRWGAKVDSFVGTRAPGVFIAAVAPLAFLAPRAYDAALRRILSRGEDVRSLLQVVISASTLPLSARRGDTARACPVWHDPHCFARRGTTPLLCSAWRHGEHAPPGRNHHGGPAIGACHTRKHRECRELRGSHDWLPGSRAT